MIVTGIVLQFPPCIRHVGDRPQQEKQSLIVNQALLNLRVPRAACKLMRFYANRSDGFRPSLKLIHDETGISTKYVSEVRQTLVSRGLIGYDGSVVLIDWVRLQGLASMQPNLMGQKKHWKITPVDTKLLGRPKKPVHTYRETRDAQSKRLYNLYEATTEAMKEGVQFPELRGKDISNLLGRPKKPVHNYEGDEGSNLLGHTKNDVHNYGYDEQASRHVGSPHEVVSWYSPFGEEDPPWVYQCPVVDAYGQILAYLHYNTTLSF